MAASGQVSPKVPQARTDRPYLLRHWRIPFVLGGLLVLAGDVSVAGLVPALTRYHYLGAIWVVAGAGVFWGWSTLIAPGRIVRLTLAAAVIHLLALLSAGFVIVPQNYGEPCPVMDMWWSWVTASCVLVPLAFYRLRMFRLLLRRGKQAPPSAGDAAQRTDLRRRDQRTR